MVGHLIPGSAHRPPCGLTPIEASRAAEHDIPLWDSAQPTSTDQDGAVRAGRDERDQAIHCGVSGRTLI